MRTSVVSLISGEEAGTQKRPSEKDSVYTEEENQIDIACGAASRNDLKLLKKLVKNGLNVNEGNFDGRTPLHVAAATGLTEVVELLVDKLGADVSAKDIFGGSPLDDAIRCKNRKVEKFLKGKDAPIGKTAAVTDDAVLLCDAASVGDTVRLQSLVKSKADINDGDYDMRTALHLAASEGKLTAVKVMLEKLKANMNVKDRWGSTPLDDAVRAGQDKVYKYLENKGGKRGREAVHSDDMATELCSAASSGDLPDLRKLVYNRANINEGDYDKRTAMHVAASEGLVLAVQCLIGLKADVNPVDRFGGTPLDDAIRHKQHAVIELLQSRRGRRGKTAEYKSDGEIMCKVGAFADLEGMNDFVHQGVSINSQNYDGRTALHMAAASGKLEVVVRMLEAHRLDRNAVDRWGSTPLDDALRGGHDNVAGFLESIGCVKGTNAESRDRVIAWSLLEAAAYGNTGKVKLFANQGASVNVGNYDQRTPLHLAAAKGHISTTKCLVEELNADVTWMDCSGRTALDEALRFRQHDVADYLTQKGVLKGADLILALNPPKSIMEPSDLPEKMKKVRSMYCCCIPKAADCAEVVALEVGYEIDPKILQFAPLMGPEAGG